jgi:hypothetical protein
MGIRAYVVKPSSEHRNGYDGCEYLRNNMVEVLDMLDDNGIPYKHCYEKSSREHDASWVIDCKNGELQQYVAKLETLSPDEIHENFIEDDHQRTNEDVLCCLKAWLQCIDPKENVIRVHWH